MKEANIYLPFWRKYKPAIQALMKAALEAPQEYPLSAHEFKAIGDSPKSGYAFNLEIENGKLINDISGSAVARDLWAMIKESSSAFKHAQSHHYKISLSSKFLLQISVL
jgi:hypothetical protein